MNNYAEHFQDIDLNNLGSGVLAGGLAGDAAADHAKVKAKPTKDGVELSCNCDNCGIPNKVLVDWNETIFISAGALPRGWKYDSGYIRPDVGCGSCKRLLTPGITPGEASRWVVAAVNARFIDPRHVASMKKQATSGLR